jgi:hypothetical protein
MRRSDSEFSSGSEEIKTGSGNLVFGKAINNFGMEVFNKNLVKTKKI